MCGEQAEKIFIHSLVARDFSLPLVARSVAMSIVISAAYTYFFYSRTQQRSQVDL